MLIFNHIPAKKIEVKLEDFFTGETDVPLNGFHTTPTVRSSSSAVCPTAATCFNEPSLPTKHTGQPQLNGFCLG